METSVRSTTARMALFKTGERPDNLRIVDCVDAIWKLARQKWEAAGKPPGDKDCFWVEAKNEVLHPGASTISK
jgi:hypothetical protein